MQIAEMKSRPPHLKFIMQAVENRNASIEQGHQVFEDIPHVVITPIGSRDSVTKVVSEWLAQSAQQVQEERLPAQWAEMFRSAFDHWKRGEEIPVNGTSLANWPAITPAELASCKAVCVLTVEDLAQANDETQRRLGMGGLELKKRAAQFLDAAHGAGRLVAENAALRKELEGVKARNEEVEARLMRLEAALPAATSPTKFVGGKQPVEDKIT